MSDQLIPESRSYRHIQCSNETEVSGESFEVVSNPMSSMEQTFCSICGAMFPITDFEWADTSEKLSDYYARHSSDATGRQAAFSLLQEVHVNLDCLRSHSDSGWLLLSCQK
jgi:hypothetical protein